MKFCKRRRYTYEGLNNVLTTTDYITFNDVRDFHGDEFTNQWEKFISKSKPFFINEQQVYYYDDYRNAAMTTYMYLNVDLE